MTYEVFVFAAEGVSGASTGFRPGARHALLVYVGDHTIDQGQVRAAEFIEESGWLRAEIKRVGTVGSDLGHIEDRESRKAAETALAGGRAMIVYATEMNADA